MLASIILATTALAAPTILPPPATAEPLHAEPPQYQPIPSAVPELIDSVIPPPPATASLFPSPTGDPFFDDSPRDLARLAPGALIAHRDVTATASSIVLAPVRWVRQLKFRSTDSTGHPTIATATVVMPRTALPSPGRRPVVVNNLAIDSLGTTCTPGYRLARGFSFDDLNTEFLPPTTQLAALRGYAVIIPDHEGPRMAYAAPQIAGHIILDAIRAATAFDPAELAGSRVAMTGYSGGAIATRAAADAVDSYAPELRSRLVGAAIGGVPADFRMLVGSMNANLGTGLLHAATLGIARENPGLPPMMNNLARWLATSPIKNLCSTALTAMGASFLPMQMMSRVPDPFHSVQAQQIFALADLTSGRSGTPLYIYQGQQEWWIPAVGALDLARAQCALGVRVDYRAMFGEHFTTSVLGFPGAISWIDDRLQGLPAPSTCGR